jgi:type I restriction enzyme M protein
LERCCQLLKPNGRLAVVLPESLLNASEMADVRLHLYRFFKIKTIVSMPRNIFIDTPTLTSLLFAQKKSGTEIAAWDTAWEKASAVVEERVKKARAALRTKTAAAQDGATVAANFLAPLAPIISAKDWIIKGGKEPSVLQLSRDWTGADGPTAAKYYREILPRAGFRDRCRNYVFSEVAGEFGYSFPVFLVEEVGYKLSKRRERARLNQLCLFRSKTSGSHFTNLHMADGEYEVVVDVTEPRTVLDHVCKRLQWD